MVLLSLQGLPHMFGFLTLFNIPIYPLPKSMQPTTPTEMTKAHTEMTKAPTVQCEPLRIPSCIDLGYNATRFPNKVGHSNQVDAGIDVRQYDALFKIECSASMPFLVCSVYAPPCDGYSDVIPPCRHVCEDAKLGCEPLMSKFGFNWPDVFSCAKFPATNGSCLDFP